MPCDCHKLPPPRTLLANAGKAAVRLAGAALRGEAIQVAPAVESERLADCVTCDRMTRHATKPQYLRCTECGCWLNGKQIAKARLATETCPLGKWKL